MRMVGRAAISWAAFQVPDSGDDDGGDDGDDDADMETEDGAGGPPDLNDYLTTADNTGFEDHPDVEFNPVLMHQVKVARDLLREQARLAALEASIEEGNDDIHQAGGVRQN